MDIYLDNSATTKLDNEVLKEMLPYLQENYGNPSSAYRIGRENKAIIENARKQVAKVLNANTEEIYFTSGGSESDNMALKGVAFANQDKGRHIITSKIEHPAVLDTCKELERHGFEITYINVDKNGIVDLKQLETSIREDTILISIMFANNEIGTIEPIKNIGRIAKQYNVLFHTDSVQAIGNIKIDVKELGIDLLSLSAHKFYGPKGIGALYVRDGVNLRKYLNGGHQESNKRAGTENVAGIVGLGEAITLAYNNLEDKNKYLYNLRTYLINEIEKNIPNVYLHYVLDLWFELYIKIKCKGGASDPRNPILHQIFSYLGYGERAGSGLYNIKAIWNEKGWKEPKIEERLNPNRTILVLSTEKNENKNDTVNVTLNDTANVTVKLNKTEKKIIVIIANNSNITQKELADELKLSYRTIKRNTNLLQEKGILKRVGADKNGYWKIIKDLMS